MRVEVSDLLRCYTAQLGR